MSVLAIHQLPAVALKQYAEMFHLPSEENKSTLAQRLYDHLHTDSGESSNSEESSQKKSPNKDDDSSSPSSSYSSPEGEHTPSRRRHKYRSLRAQHKHCSQRARGCERTLTISPPSGHFTRARGCSKRCKEGICHRNRRCSPSSSDSSSSSTQGSSHSHSLSSTTSSGTSSSQSPINRPHSVLTQPYPPQELNSQTPSTSKMK